MQEEKLWTASWEFLMEAASQPITQQQFSAWRLITEMKPAIEWGKEPDWRDFECGEHGCW